MADDLHITDARRGAAFTVIVYESAAEVGILGVQENRAIEISLTEPLAGGRADAQLVAFLADALGIDSGQIAIIAGQDKPKKIISVDGISPGQLEDRLFS